MKGWQPIETAPRDGVEFLSVANYTDEPRQVQIVDWDFVQQCEPGLYTHWMPLPELPMQPDEKGEVAVPRNESGEIVPVSRQDSDEALLRQALEALLGQRGEPDWHTGKQRENAIAALRERLGEKA